MIIQDYQASLDGNKSCGYRHIRWYKLHVRYMLRGMDSHANAAVSSTLPPVRLPAWAHPRGRELTEADAAFAVGIALKSLDDLVRCEPIWAGCWRARQALKCAAAAVRLIGRNEDETALRDAGLLTGTVTIWGRPGACFWFTKGSRVGSPAFSLETVAELAELLKLAWDDRMALIPEIVDAVLQSGRSAPFAAADLVSAIVSERPRKLSRSPGRRPTCLLPCR